MENREAYRDLGHEVPKESVPKLQKLLETKVDAVKDVRPATERGKEELAVAEKSIEARRLLSLQLTA